MPREVQSAEQVRWVESAPFFNFHTVNAYEDGQTIQLTLRWYDAYMLTPDRKVKLELY